MPSAIIGSVLVLGIVSSMAAVATPAFILFADSQRGLLAAQAELNAETLACIDDPGTCTRIGAGEYLVCQEEDDVKVCWVQDDDPRRANRTLNRTR